MLIHSTCRDCGGSLLVDPEKLETVHKDCQPQPTRIERLAQQWLDAIQDLNQFDADLLEEQINELNNRPPRLREAALAYAGWGWPVFPLKPRSKAPATKTGFKDATTNFERIDTWWKKQPDANVGLPTGTAFDVIDIDPPDGAHSYLELLAEKLIPDVHGWVATSSGGTHLYIEPTGDGNRTGLRPGVDYRGTGGYVVAPPSTLGQPGRSWSWAIPPSAAIKPGLGA